MTYHCIPILLATCLGLWLFVLDYWWAPSIPDPDEEPTKDHLR